DKLEDQWSDIVSDIELLDDWRIRIEGLAGDGKEREAIIEERKLIEERLRRLARLYQDMLIGDLEYRDSRESWRRRLETLVVPENPKIIEAGSYLENIGDLWFAASLEEKRDLTRIMVGSIVVNVIDEMIVGIEAVDSFHFVFSKICKDMQVEVIK
ncbi:MAG TPA: hypothetical protein VFI27_12865, partial [candidate division Zixibacteria bacterium]|nr:hypothetical protein [candidate division Zixibacteria bacterium]